MGPLSFEQRIRQGNAYTASSPSIATAITSNVAATLQNPANSGKTIYIYSLESVVGSAGTFFASVSKNPTAGLPATAISPVNQNFNSSNTSVGVINCAASPTALSGGTTLYTLGIPGANRTPFKEQLLVIAPGVTIGFNIPILLVTNLNFTINYWEEQ